MSDKLYNIEPKEFKVLERNELGNSITYTLEPINRPLYCPECHGTNFIQHGINQRKARDLNEFGKLVGLVIKGHRYRCKDCGKSWVDQYESIESDAKMTNRMRDYIREQALQVPFSHIKRELDVAVPTVEKIFTNYVDVMEEKRVIVAPKILGMDETMLNGIYRGMFVDVENRLILDMTEDRKLVTIKRWLQHLPRKERIECVTIDMWGPYKDAILSELPDVFIIIDKFHVIKHLNEALDIIRKKATAQLTDKERRHIKGNRWLLLKNSEELDFMAQCRLQDLLYSFPKFQKPHQIKESFREIYLSQTREEAEKAFDEWKTTITDYPEYLAFADTVENWRTEIFNYFDKRYTNAITEALNRVSKEISAQGKGYNFKVLRAKLLYRNEAVKPARFAYYEEPMPTQEIKPDFDWNGFDIYIQEPNGGYIIVEAMTDLNLDKVGVPSGVNIDALSEYFSRHTSRIFQRAIENKDPDILQKIKADLTKGDTNAISTNDTER